MRTDSILEQEKVGVLMRKSSVPCILSLLIAALYNIVDQIFIANASYLGAHWNAANESRYYTDFAIRAFRITLCLMPLATVNKGTFIYLQSLGRALQSSVLSMIREILFGVGFALLLPVFFGLNGVLYPMPLSDGLTFLIAAWIIRGIFETLAEPQA